MSVDLVSESGRTRITVKITSPLFATLLSMYDLHDIPDRIALRGSLGEIFDEEYKKLMKGDVVALSEVSRIIKVLDVGKDELVRIYADSSCTRDTRFHHYEEVGSSWEDCISYVWTPVSGYCGFILGRLQTEYEGDDKATLLGAIRSAYLASMPDDGGTFSPEAILWEDFLPFTQEGSTLRNSVRLLAGLLDDPEAELHLPWRLLHHHTSPTFEQPDKKATRFVYSRLLQMIPEEVTPHDFGIASMVTYSVTREQPQTPREDSVTVVKIINRSLTSHFDLTLTNYEGYLDGLVELIGREGISRFSLSLYHYNKKSGTVYSRACASLIDSYLRGSKTYPSPYLFSLSILLVLSAVALFVWRWTSY
jgi:hypothetical protein